jgi:hypothetical protein
MNESKQIRLAFLARQIAQKQVIRADIVRQLTEVDTSLSITQSEYNGIKNECAPIASLPNELLATIIEMGYHLSEVEGLSRTFEVAVSHVTRHWRAIAINTPRIWAKIQRLPAQTSLNSTIIYLQRSKAVPLDLSIDICEGADGHNHVTSFIQLINAHVHRWRRLWVRSKFWMDHRIFVEGMPTASAPLLQSIDICLENPPSAGTGAARIIFADGAPSLTSVVVKGVGKFCWLPPLRGVTNLCLDNIDVDRAIWTEFRILHDMFRCMSSLTRLVVNGDIAQSWPPGMTIDLVSLRVLDVRADPDREDAAQVSGLLLAISAPSLQSLTLRGVVDDDFPGFIQSTLSGPPKFQTLRSLVLDLESALNVPCLRDLFRALPTVTEFTYAGPRCPCFFPLLQETVEVAGSSAAVIFPNLHTISFRPTSAQIALARDVIAARIDMRHPIRSLRVPRKLLVERLMSDRWQWLRDQVQLEEFTDCSETQFISTWDGLGD